MIEQRAAAPRPWTWIGLAIALGGIPFIVVGQRTLFGDISGAAELIARELVIFLLLAALLWIVFRQEHQDLRSIGLKTDTRDSLIWSLALVLLCMVALAAALVLLSLLNIPFGEEVPAGSAPRYQPPWWAVLFTLFRAAIVEEIFYRGYAIERLTALTGNIWLAAGLPLVCFALFHYRQGLGGIIVAFALGVALTGFYLWKRDLLANIVAHFVVDFVPNILLPLVSGD